jgi:hypothetical protein
MLSDYIVFEKFYIFYYALYSKEAYQSFYFLQNPLYFGICFN